MGSLSKGEQVGNKLSTVESNLQVLYALWEKEGKVDCAGYRVGGSDMHCAQLKNGN